MALAAHPGADIVRVLARHEAIFLALMVGTLSWKDVPGDSQGELRFVSGAPLRCAFQVMHLLVVCSFQYIELQCPG